MSVKHGIAAAQPPLNPLIHEAARLQIVAVLNECTVADFNFLLGTTGLTRGNLSTHLSRLTAARYVTENKAFVGRMPHTDYSLTDAGRDAYRAYLQAWQKVTKPQIKR